MNTVAIKRGAIGGVLGGIAMAMWSMIVMWLSGAGFWPPLNLIAHTMWRPAPLDATFSAAGLVIGMIVHMVMSIVLGAVLALLLTVIGGWATSAIGAAAGGMVFGLVVWLIMQFGLWPTVDEAAAERFTPWVFAVGHLMYGLVTGLVITGARIRVGAVRTAR